MVHPSEFAYQEDEAVKGVPEDRIEKTLEVDFVLRITTDESGEDIDFEKIVRFVMWLKRNGYWIRRVTYDSWQSAHSIQQFKTYRMEAGVRSVDRTTVPYNVLKRALAERRIIAPFHSYLNVELGSLMYLSDRDKVDHPKQNADGTPGSKDCADALAASVYECIIDKLTPADEPVRATTAADSGYEDYLDDIKEFL